MDSVLRYQGYKIIALNDDLYAFIISIASGEKNFEAMEACLKENSVITNK